MATSGGVIQASDYNTIQDTIGKILGQSNSSDPLFGYGQAVNSSQVIPLSDTSIPDGDSVTTQQINNLLEDLKIVHKHQTGNDLEISVYQTGDIIGADASGTDMLYADSGSRSIQNIDTQKGINDLSDIADTLSIDPFVVSPSQTSTVIVYNDTRTRDWNDTIVSEFTVTFSSAAERRHFFNSGGRIEIEGSTISGTTTNLSGPRDDGWTDMLSNVGKVIFDYQGTNDIGNATGVTKPNGNLGNYDLTTSYQVILRKDPGAGLYENSFWYIEARENSSSELSFRTTLVDAGPEGGPDELNEPITIDINFTYGYRKADGAVIAPTPTFNLLQDFNVNQSTETFISTPSNQSPSNNAIIGVNEDFDFVSSSFNVVNGSDTHEASQWYVYRVSDNQPILYFETTTNLTSTFATEQRFSAGEDYEWQVRYKGTNLGWSPYSTATRFSIR
jgi:hypothetical protein